MMSAHGELDCESSNVWLPKYRSPIKDSQAIRRAKTKEDAKPLRELSDALSNLWLFCCCYRHRHLYLLAMLAGLCATGASPDEVLSHHF